MGKMESLTNGEQNTARERSHVTHDARIHIEFGKQTWTVAQTVRDLMQNALDAETEKYYYQIAEIVFNRQTLLELRGVDDEMKARVSDFLFDLYNYSKYHEDMDLDAKRVSRAILTEKAKSLPVDTKFLNAEKDLQFFPIHKEIIAIEEEKPNVKFLVRNKFSDKKLWVESETLASEELYQQKTDEGDWEYNIIGMRISDAGSGYDPQLSSLMMTSKLGKRHVRGKFGEGSKMSELDLLRAGATMKLRSTYEIADNASPHKYHSWQLRPSVLNQSLRQSGVQVKHSTADTQTGTTIEVRIDSANVDYQREFRVQCDPREGGLGRNIQLYDDNPNRFFYPLPIGGWVHCGVDVKSKSSSIYVQDIQVDAGDDRKIVYSYNIHDSSVVNGRDRNSLNMKARQAIFHFWRRNHSKGLIKTLVHDAFHTKKLDGSAEKIVLDQILGDSGTMVEEGRGNQIEFVDIGEQQKLLDAEVLNSFVFREQKKHILVSSAYRQNRIHYVPILDYARRVGYEVIEFEGDIEPEVIDAICRRNEEYYPLTPFWKVKDEYEKSEFDSRIYGFDDIDEEKEGEIWENDWRMPFFVERAGRAVNRVNSILESLGETPMPLSIACADTSSHGTRDPENPKKCFRRGFQLYIDFAKFDEPGEPDDSDFYDSSQLIEFERNLVTYLFSTLGEDWEVQRKRDELAQQGYDIEYRKESWLEIMRRSQQNVERILAKIIHMRDDLMSVMDGIDHPSSELLLHKILEKKLHKSEAPLEHIALASSLERQLVLCDCTYQDASRIVAILNTIKSLDEQLRSIYENVISLITQRVFQGTTGYWKVEQGAVGREFVVVPAQVISYYNGYPVILVNMQTVFVSIPNADDFVYSTNTPKGRVMAFKQNDLMVTVDNSVMVFDGSYELTNGITIVPGGVNLTVSSNFIKWGARALEQAVASLMECVVMEKHEVRVNESAIETGILQSNISVDYGLGEWDKPFRVFQDVAQNHIDANLGGSIGQRFKVLRNEKFVWLPTEEVSEHDSILGVEYSDSGDGYLPNHIATVGSSSKRGPRYAGKYGEGMKMVTAAALRSGVSIQFGSHSKTVSKSWRADGVALDMPVQMDGEIIIKTLVGYDVVEIETTALSSGSFTRIEFVPEKSDLATWDSWMNIVHPAKKNEQGHGGLARYVRQLRAPGSELIEEVDGITIIKNESGTIYENGLSINPECAEGRNRNFGYDGTAFMATRERSDVRRMVFDCQVSHVLSHTTDDQIVDRVVSHLLLDALLDEGPRRGSAQELGMDQLYYRRLQGNKAKVLERLVDSVGRKILIKDSVGNTAQSNGEISFQDQLDRDWLARNEGYIPKENRLVVPGSIYEKLEMVLTTFLDFKDKFQTQRVPIPDESLKQLARVAVSMVNIMHAQYVDTGVPKNYNTIHDVWSNQKLIELREMVGLSPFDMRYGGITDTTSYVLIAEQLLSKNTRAEFLEVMIHELVHVFTKYSDFTSEFVYEFIKIIEYILDNEDLSQLAVSR